MTVRIKVLTCSWCGRFIVPRKQTLDLIEPVTILCHNCLTWGRGKDGPIIFNMAARRHRAS